MPSSSTLSLSERNHPSRTLQFPVVSPDARPFQPDDLTAGSEVELQAAVAGRREAVDLARSIEQSTYFANLMRRARSGDTSGRWLSELEQFLSGNDSQVWENSWVSFPLAGLDPFARGVLEQDLLVDKSRPERGRRRDAERFLIREAGAELLRVPVSYLVKLALADRIGRAVAWPAPLRETAIRLMGHFLNDNTSPETHSFHVVAPAAGTGPGPRLARETAKRYLLTQLLVTYANRQFRLEERGQKALVYFAPHPPQRQKALNRIIPDAFYRELFMSPCLSGWDEGEGKHEYMHLCHRVLSRSQLQAVAKLREAGIIQNNLVVLPSVSSTSLANNGTHVSLGSRQLGVALQNSSGGFGRAQEKYFGDLAIKVQEHFLPLFVGTFSASPYRLGFADFHPEKALGFLPHQLDYTHLRMLWRRWKGKAQLSLLRRPLTPFGPEWLDQSLGGLLGLAGDLVPDFRLLDYPVGMLSTSRSPALDGSLGNQQRLREDLHDLGEFDRQMSLYLPCKLREFAVMGFSGFEWRHYSLFPTFGRDMSPAVDLQALVTAYAYRLIANGEISHRQIPDNPMVESERRQLLFASALGVPTVYVRRNSRNLLLRRILRRVRKLRQSRRYPGYYRVPVQNYCLALVELLREEAADLVAAFGLEEGLHDLTLRIMQPDGFGAAGRLTNGILETLGARKPLRVPAAEFNVAAENYYREGLRQQQLEEALVWLESDLLDLERRALREDDSLREGLRAILGEKSIQEVFARCREDFPEGRPAGEVLRQLIDLLLLSVQDDTRQAQDLMQRGDHAQPCLSPPVRRAV